MYANARHGIFFRLGSYTLDWALDCSTKSRLNEWPQPFQLNSLISLIPPLIHMEREFIGNIFSFYKITVRLANCWGICLWELAVALFTLEFFCVWTTKIQTREKGIIPFWIHPSISSDLSQIPSNEPCAIDGWGISSRQSGLNIDVYL